jgi:hypothetical protein
MARDVGQRHCGASTRTPLAHRRPHRHTQHSTTQHARTHTCTTMSLRSSTRHSWRQTSRLRSKGVSSRPSSSSSTASCLRARRVCSVCVWGGGVYVCWCWARACATTHGAHQSAHATRMLLSCPLLRPPCAADHAMPAHRWRTHTRLHARTHTHTHAHTHLRHSRKAAFSCASSWSGVVDASHAGRRGIVSLCAAEHAGNARGSGAQQRRRHGGASVVCSAQ